MPVSKTYIQETSDSAVLLSYIEHIKTKAIVPTPILSIYLDISLCAHQFLL